MRSKIYQIKRLSFRERERGFILEKSVFWSANPHQTGKSYLKIKRLGRVCVIDYVWQTTNEADVQDLPLFVEYPSIPNEFVSRLPAYQRNASKGQVDYDRIHKTSKRLGDLGEEFIRRYEIEKLDDYNFDSLRPTKMKDGDGYDIKSFNQDKEEIYIEVKTTVGSIGTPFFISDNELQFLKDNARAIIYRVFNFKPEKMIGQIYRLTYSDLIKFNVTSHEHKVFLS